MFHLVRPLLIAGLLLGRLRVSCGLTLIGISAVLLISVGRVLNRTANVLTGLWVRFANPLTLFIVAACGVVPLMQTTWGRTAGGLAAFWCLAHLGGVFRSGLRPSRRPPAGAAPQSPFDEAAFIASLTAQPDRVLRQLVVREGLEGFDADAKACKAAAKGSQPFRRPSQRAVCIPVIEPL